MKIVVVYQYFGSKQSGWSTRFYDFAIEWQQQGCEVEIITSPYYKSDIQNIDGFIKKINIDGIKVTVVNTPDSNKDSFLKRSVNALLFSLTTSWLVTKRHADVFIFSSGPITVGIPMIIKRLFKRDGIIFEHRDIWPDGAIEMGLLSGWKANFAKRFGDYLNRKANAVVVCSDGMRDVLCRRSLGKVSSIPHGCDLTLLNNIGNYELPEWTKNTRILIYAGSLGFMDSVGEAIFGFINARVSTNTHFVILGDGADRQNLEQIAAASNKSRQIHFLGLVSKVEMAHWYSIAVASFVLFKNFPILSTSSPNKFFDSLIFGVPVIQNTNGWIREIVISEGIGYNVNPDDVNAMSDAIEGILNHDSTTKEMALKAKNLAIKSLDRKKMAHKYLELIQDI